MATDNYPSEEGYICDGNVIGFCKCQAAVEFLEVVYIHGTNVAGYISVAPAAADGDGIAVALKEGAAGDYIPVCFFGIVKMYAGAAMVPNDAVINDSLGTYVLPIPTYTHDEFVAWRGYDQDGSQCVLGTCLGHAAASGDEVLILVGRVI